jgi:hypothetical protein
VQQIVSALDGSLDLHTSSAGTEFVVVLPAAVSLRSVPEVRKESGMSDNGGAGGAGGTTVQDAVGR